MRRTITEKIFYYEQPRLYQRMIGELETAEERVAWILERHPRTRDSDQWLIYLYWKLVDKAEGKLKHIAGQLTAAGTITRCRRKIQHDLKLFLPNDRKIRKIRKIREEVFKHWAKR